MGQDPHAPGRRHPRVRTAARAIVHGDAGVTACDVVDLSLGGLLLQRAASGGELPAVGDPVTVELHLHGSGCRWYDLSAHVCRRAAADRIAVELVRVPPDLEDEIEEEVLAVVEATTRPPVVVVDHPGARRQRLVATLRRAGCRPIVVGTPLDAIERLQESRTHAAAVFIAAELTQTHGEELACYLAEEHPEIRIAIIHEPGRAIPTVVDGVVVIESTECEHPDMVRRVLAVG